MQSDWLPAGGILQTQAITTTRQLAHTLFWGKDQQPYPAGDSLIIDLTLNDSDNSSLGPGVYFDISKLLFVKTNLPLNKLTIKTYASHIEQHIQITASDLTAITSTVASSILLSFAPGTAAQDNANLSFSLQRQYCIIIIGCFTNITLRNCNLFDQPWQVAPIPGTFSYSQPPAENCYDGGLAWLPGIQR